MDGHGHHKRDRRELLDHVAPFESLPAAQAALDAWLHTYNHQRPHQSLDMATPASRFRPHGPSRDHTDTDTDTDADAAPPAGAAGIDVIEPPAEHAGGGAVEFELRVPPSGELSLVPGKQKVSVNHGLVGQTLTVWADLRSIHLVLHGHPIRTIASRLAPADLAHLAMRGARPAGPPPAVDALPRRDGRPHLPAGGAVEVDRRVQRDGHITIAGHHCQVGFGLAGRTITIRLDGHLMHAIADNALLGTWPSPITTQRAAKLGGLRAAATPLPPPPLPDGSIRAQRRVHASGRIMVAKQAIKLGPRHAGKLVTVVIEDTHFRILHGDEQLAIKPRKDTTPLTRLYVRGKATQPN